MTLSNIVLIMQMILSIAGLFCIVRVAKLFGFRDPIMLLSMICVTLSLLMQTISNIISMAQYSSFFRNNQTEE